MKILALLHGPSASGADTTIRRVAAHLAGSGHSVLFIRDCEDSAELARTAKEHDVDAMIGTHALLSGKPFREVGLPYVLIFGGTDLNEFALDEESLEVMTEAVLAANALVAFNEDFAHRCRRLWPTVSDKLRLIPQGVATEPSTFSLRRQLELAPDATLLLLPAGLRPVKDPLFLIDRIKQWHEQDPDLRLVIAGTCYLPEYGELVLRRCASSPAVRWIGTLPRADLHAAMLEATAVLNTSLSECSPNSILEAMQLGRPVVVRDIPGNTCLVEHDVTGLVFADPAGLRAQVQRLLDDPTLGPRIGRAAQQSVRRSHGLHAESLAYAEVFDELDRQSSPARRTACRSSGWPAERVVDVNSVELCVQSFGRPDDPAVLLIAGTSASMLAWDTGFCRQLAAGGRFVIRYDHRDTGRSVSYPAGRPPYGLPDLAADALGVLDSFGLRSAHLAGISMGGVLAQLVALDHPERVASLTLLASSPGDAPGSPELPGTPLALRMDLDDVPLPDWTDRAEVVEHLVAVERLMAGDGRPFDEHRRREVAGQVFDRAPQALPSAANHQLLEPAPPWRGRLGELDVPVLVVAGGRDAIYPLAHSQALAAEIAGARLLVLNEAGHELAAADWPIVIPAILRHTRTA